MAVIKSITVSVCAIITVYGCLSLIQPPGNMNKSFKRVMGLIVISAVTVPIVRSGGILSDIKISDNGFKFSTESCESSVNYMYLDAANEAIKSELESMLTNEGINNYKISVITDISDDGNIFIDRVLVTCNETDRNKVSDILEKAGVKAEINGYY